MALRQLIEGGEWSAGSQLPNEDKLGEMLGISRITLRHALRNLEEAGLLRREHGRGTFVRSATVVAGVHGLTSFTEEMRTLALTASSRLVEANRIAATLEIAEALEIGTGDPVMRWDGRLSLAGLMTIEHRLSVPDSFAFWQRANGCTGPIVESTLPLREADEPPVRVEHERGGYRIEPRGRRDAARPRVRTERGDLAVADQQFTAGDHAVADGVEIGTAQHHGLAGRCGRVGGGGRAGGEAEQQRGKNARHQ